MIRLSVLWTSLNLIRIAALPWSTHYTALPAARHTISSDVVSDSSSLRFTPHSQHLRSIDPLYNQLPGSPDSRAKKAFLIHPTLGQSLCLPDSHCNWKLNPRRRRRRRRKHAAGGRRRGHHHRGRRTGRSRGGARTAQVCRCLGLRPSYLSCDSCPYRPTDPGSISWCCSAANLTCAAPVTCAGKG